MGSAKVSRRLFRSDAGPLDEDGTDPATGVAWGSLEGDEYLEYVLVPDITPEEVQTLRDEINILKRDLKDMTARHDNECRIASGYRIANEILRATPR